MFVIGNMQIICYNRTENLMLYTRKEMVMINNSNKNQRIAYALVFVLFIFIHLSMINTVSGREIDTFGFTDDEIIRTINNINKVRAVYDLPSLSYNESLNKTSETHNQYMAFNNSFSSIEESGKTYFRGRYPWDRTTFNNYRKPYVFELLNNNISNYTSGLNQLIQNPYARYGILDPLYEDLGMNIYKGYATYLLGGKSRSDQYEVVYPYNQQTDVGTIFTNKYILNPYADVKTNAFVGIPITYTYYEESGIIERFNNLKVSVTNVSTDKEIDTLIITSDQDRNINNTIMILPLKSYNYGTTYQIKITGTMTFDRMIDINGTQTNRKSINYTSTFTTASSSFTSNQQAYITRSQFVEELMKTSSIPKQESLEIIFSDVNINSPNYKYIYTAYINDIILGYENNMYRPNANISREQVYTILIRTYEKEYGTINLLSTERSLRFTDKEKISSYALESLYKAKKIGLITDNAYQFNPSSYITTLEFNNIMEQYKKIIK